MPHSQEYQGRYPDMPPTPNQIDVIRRMANERSMPADLGGAIAKLLSNPSRFKRSSASAMIGRLGQLPQPDRVGGLDLTGMVSGRYAVPGSDTRLKLRIDVVTEGSWAGWVFVKDAAVYGEHRRYGAQRPGQSYVGDCEDALRAIMAAPMAAAAEYGRLTETCGVCGRPLEDPVSVARGIGPVCAGRYAA